MIAHPTPILQTTRFGSRTEVPRMNHSWCSRKGEPSRRRGHPWWPRGKVSPEQKGPRPRGPWTDASSFLVIVHYLLKNNTQFIGGYVQGRVGTLGFQSTRQFTSGGAQPW